MNVYDTPAWKQIGYWVSVKGSETINRVSELRGDSIKAVPGHLVHKDCRRNYVNPNASVNSKEAGSTTPTVPRPLCSRTPDFRFKDNCLYCGQHAKFNGIKDDWI